MAKAKLTTRAISTTAVTSDNLAKGSQLTHNQLDSNFLNLRDATFGVVADDSATIQIGMDSNLYIQGGDNVTTSTDSAGVVTINATSDVTASSSTTFTNKTIDVDNNTVSNIEVDNLKSGVLDTDLASVSGSDDTLASAKAIKSYVDSSAGAGWRVVGDDSAGVDIAEGGTLYIQGGTNVTTSTDSSGVVTINGAGTATSLTTDGLTIEDNNITGTRSAENIVISTNSSGNIILDGYKVQIGDDDSTGPNPWRYYTDTNPPTIKTPNANDDLVFETTPSDPNVGGHFVFQGGGDPRIVLRGTAPTGGAHHLGPGGINGTLNIYGGGVQHENGVDKPNLFNVGYYSAKITLHSGDGFSDNNADIDLAPLGSGEVNIEGTLDVNGDADFSGSVTAATSIDNDAIKIDDNKIITTRSNDNLYITTAGSGDLFLQGGDDCRLQPSDDVMLEPGDDIHMFTTGSGKDIKFWNVNSSKLLWYGNYAATWEIIKAEDGVDQWNGTGTNAYPDTGDDLWTVNVHGGNGTGAGDYAQGGKLLFEASADWSGSSRSTSFEIQLAQTGSTSLTTPFKIGATGDVVLTGGLTVGTSIENDAIKIDDHTISGLRSNDNIVIDPAGTGDILLGNFRFDVDQSVGSGQDNYVLTYDHSGGKISLEASSGGGDTGDITFVGSTIISPSNADLTLNPAGTGKVNINAVYTLPNADGSANQVLGTNGSGVLSFRDPTAINIDGGVADSDYTSVPTIDGGTA